MLFRPDTQDLRVIGLNTGRVLVGVGLGMLLCTPIGVLRGEPNDVAALVIGACLALLLGRLAEWRLAHRHRIQWQHGMVVAALSWLVASLTGAVPLHLSGHYLSFLDAYFEAMSGFTTSGLSTANDLDHMAASILFWRVLTHFIGGQGLVVMFISVFAAGAGAVGMYAGEAREDRILPNLQRTARFIWRVSLGYLAVGTAALWAALIAAGMPSWDGLFHAVMLFIAGFDTGGFTPTTASLGLYHSPLVELVASFTMVAGALSFAMHYQLWRGRPRELLRNVETRLLTTTFLSTFLLVALGLVQSDTYHDAAVVLRRGLFQALSAHTGTGFNTVPGQFFASGWGVLAPGALVIAMALGGMAGSTSGGIKSIRLALVGKHMRQELRKLLLPPDAYTIETYHSNGPQVVRPAAVRSALMILLLFLLLDLLGALAGLFYGYPFDLAMFESTSAANNVGLSVGIAGPGAEAPLTLVYTLQMWIGRLEFVAVLALVGFVVAAMRGRT